MNLRLSNYGHRYASEVFRKLAGNLSTLNLTQRLLLDMWTGILVPDQGQPGLIELDRCGFIERVPVTVTKAETELRYRHNPLEHISKIIFELTTHCNFNCQHCYNATVPRITEQDLPGLKKAVDVFRAIGIERFDFIGGEITRYGDGWLDLAQYCRQQGAKIVTIYTNGWWLEQKNFIAAGNHYPDVSTYLVDLREHGVTHILFSLDGPEEMHDRSRGQPGLFDRVLAGIPAVKAAGLLPRVSLLMRKDLIMDTYVQLLDTLANRIYDFPDSADLIERVNYLASDQTNTLSNLIDIGNQATQSPQDQGFYLWQPTDQQLYCRGFYRPAPSLTIKANGEVATCRISNAGEGYGNIHNQDLIWILNHLQDAFIYRLHAEHRLGEYRKFVDTDIFGTHFAHLCSLRSILTRIAYWMETEAIDPQDQAAVHAINLRVAEETGHRKRSMMGQSTADQENENCNEIPKNIRK